MIILYERASNNNNNDFNESKPRNATFEQHDKETCSSRQGRFLSSSSLKEKRLSFKREAHHCQGEISLVRAMPIKPKRFRYVNITPAPVQKKKMCVTRMEPRWTPLGKAQGRERKRWRFWDAGDVSGSDEGKECSPSGVWERSVSLFSGYGFSCFLWEGFRGSFWLRETSLCKKADFPAAQTGRVRVRVWNLNVLMTGQCVCFIPASAVSLNSFFLPSRNMKTQRCFRI